MSGRLIDGTGSAAITGGIDDFSSRVVTNDYYRTNCVNATLWNDVAEGIIALQRRLSLHVGDSALAFPVGVATNSTSSLVYVVDAQAALCLVYGASGEFMASFGGYGSAGGKLNYPTSVAIDNLENVHISDSLNHRIQAFDKYGTYLFTYCGNQTATGTLSYAWSIVYGTYDGDPAVWAYDWQTYRLLAFNPTSGEILTSILPSITAPGSRGLAFSSASSGQLLITDPAGNRVITYDLATSTTTVAITGVISPTGIAIDADGKVWIVSASTTDARRYTLSGNTLTYDSVSISLGGSSRLIYDIDSMPSYGGTSLYVADSDGHTVQVRSVTGGSLLEEITEVDNDPYWLVKPYDVTVDSADDAYIIDSYTCQLTKVTSLGQGLLRFGTKGYDTGEFQNPVSVSVAGSGDIYIVDMDRDAIYYFTSSGTYSGCVTGTYISTPTAVRVASGGDWMVVVEESGTRVAKYTRSGETWTRLAIGSKGTGTGQYSWVKDVTIGSSGNIYILDGSYGKVFVYNSSGVYQTMYWTGTSLPGFTGVAVDSSGVIYITDAFLHKLRTYNPSTDTWSIYTVSGAKRLWGIDVTSSGVKYVCDPDNSRVVVLDSDCDYSSQFKYTSNLVFDPVESGGAKLVSPLRGLNSNLTSPNEIDPVSTMYGNTHSWDRVMVTTSQSVTGVAGVASIPFYMEFTCPEDTLIFPVDWRASVRTTSTSITGMPIVTLVRPASGGAENDYIEDIDSVTKKVTLLFNLSNRDGTLLPSITSGEPCIVTAFIQGMRL